MTAYLDNATYRRQKSALTRAVNSGDPLLVLRAVEKALREWEGCAWPDDWHRWNVALRDARYKYVSSDEWGLPMPETLARFDEAFVY